MTGAPPRARFEADEIDRVLARFEIGDVRSAEAFDRGSRRSPKLVVDAHRGRFLLKRRQPEQAGEHRVRFAHAVIEHLVDRGLPLPRLVPDRDGATDVRLGGHCYELFHFMPGRRPRPTAPAAAIAGRVLADVHRSGGSFVPPSDPKVGSWHGVDTVTAIADRIPARIARHTPGADQADVGRCCRFLRRAYADAAARAEPVTHAPPVLCHGDLHPGNLLAADGNLTAILDFDAARFEPAVLDVANASLQFAVDRPTDDPADWPGVLGYDRIRALVQAYQAAGGILTASDRSALPWLMIEALVVESLAPIARDGSFGHFRGDVFLRMVERKVRWLRERSGRLVAYLEQPA